MKRVTGALLAIGVAAAAIPSASFAASEYDPSNKCWSFKDHNPVWVCSKNKKKVAQQKANKKKVVQRKKYRSYPQYTQRPPYAPEYYPQPYYYNYPSFGYYPSMDPYEYPYGYYPYGYRRPGFFFGFGG